jgi:hypothetical protein
MVQHGFSSISFEPGSGPFFKKVEKKRLLLFSYTILLITLVGQPTRLNNKGSTASNDNLIKPKKPRI